VHDSGSPHHGVTIADPEMVVLESDPYRRLSYTWHNFTDELAPKIGLEGERLARMRAEQRSRVAFEIEETEHGVRLTAMHGGFEPGSAVLEGISGGWPIVVSRLKTLLETEDADLALRG
jgi:uncharacterized protein YndB with AHSA1/START domain